jgi:hypothetical protein
MVYFLQSNKINRSPGQKLSKCGLNAEKVQHIMKSQGLNVNLSRKK